MQKNIRDIYSMSFPDKIEKRNIKKNIFSPNSKSILPFDQFCPFDHLAIR
jgi:hypothetical protein